jgi:hypothetical protein
MTTETGRNEEMEEREKFLTALRKFCAAGQELADAWNGEHFYADEAAPLPEALTPPMSLDEWLMELQVHYEEALA